ncbi:1343_t:CDS:2 [Paraglomus brasilianum]|uniref:1343_t:CDS:1 n=1 Tax=Paraglomus brasilianum TaxID=144538 RepID=A0A9N9BZU9_9GLOM|nr:1343_t:CDS:2 [Paraglomus brasilianum]
MSGSSTTTLTVLSLNCWGLAVISKLRPQRMEAIADALATSAYEIVGLQEVWVYADYELIRSRTKSRFPYSKFFHSGIFGGGLAILSRYPVVEVSFHPYRLNGRAINFYHGDWYVGKGVASIVIDHPVGGFTEVFNTHTHAGYGPREKDEYLSHRIAQGWEIANILRASAARGRNVIALGDFNSRSDTLFYKLVTTHGQITDAWNFQQKTSRFWCSNAKVVFTEVIPELNCSFTDHFGVEATFTIVGGGKASVIPLTVWEQGMYDYEHDSDSATFDDILEVFRNDLEKSISKQKLHFAIFYTSSSIIFIGILMTIIIQASALNPPSWVIVIITIAIALFAALGTIFGLIGLLSGNSEQNGLKLVIDEVESWTEGKKIVESRRTSYRDDGGGSQRSSGGVEIDVKKLT